MWAAPGLAGGTEDAAGFGYDWTNFDENSTKLDHGYAGLVDGSMGSDNGQLFGLEDIWSGLEAYDIHQFMDSHIREI